jgi:hypothetical protein
VQQLGINGEKLEASGVCERRVGRSGSAAQPSAVALPVRQSARADAGKVKEGNDRPMRIGVMLTLLIASACYAANESGVALKADSIKSEPFKDADDVGDLKKGDSVQIVSKKGGWLRIKAPAGTGWVRVLSVKRGAGGGSSAAGELAVSPRCPLDARHGTDHLGHRLCAA